MIHVLNLLVILHTNCYSLSLTAQSSIGRELSTRNALLQIMLMVLHGTYGGTRLHKWNDMKEVKEMCRLQNSHQNHLRLIHNNVLCTKRYLFPVPTAATDCFELRPKTLIASSAFRCTQGL